MIFTNKELVLFSTLPITIWSIIFVIYVLITTLNNSEYFTLTVYFNEGINLIMICFLYGLIGLTVNRTYEVYYE